MPFTIERKPVGSINKDCHIQKVLKLIIFLKENRTVKECSEYIGVRPRSIQRYFQLIMNLGFKMVTNVGRRYSHQIINLEEYFREGHKRS